LLGRRSAFDFVGAVGIGFLASQAIGMVHTDPPTSVFTQWPRVLFPAYMVPFSIILHIITIRVLLANRGRDRDELLSRLEVISPRQNSTG
jgi:hypothetical protein